MILAPVLALLCMVQPDLTGKVMGPGGKPLKGARVQAGDRYALTDGQGAFRLALPPGTGSVRVTAPGLEAQTREIVRPLLVLLEPEVKEAVVEVVEGASYGSEGASSALSRMEIYMTPGAAADVFQGVKFLPGVSNASEGAELFVRGGKPEEVGIYLNGGRLAHPFHHPTTQGGIFSSVDTALVSRLDFIPGGFSARYGDALSAVLELSTASENRSRSGALLLNLASQGVQADEPLGGGLLRGSLRHADPTLLDKWYGLAATFEESPRSDDLHLDWQRKVGTGSCTATALLSRDHLALDTRIQDRSAVYRNRSDTGFLAGTLTQGLGEGALLNLAASRSWFSSAWSFDRWGLARKEGETFLRAEVVAQAGTLTLEGGMDLARASLDPEGQVPLDLDRWGPDAPARAFAYGFTSTRAGAYLTVRIPLSDRWGLSLGGRQDRYGLPGETTRDPRATVSFRQGKLSLLASGGTFHQMPPMTQLDPWQGNPALRILRATHALLSGEWREDRGAVPWMARLELYRKDYDRLVVEDPLLRYASTGRGMARGADLLLKARLGAWRGHLAYGWLDTRRREGDQPVLGPVPTSVPHSLTVVAGWGPRPGWDLSGSFRHSSGAPATPVLGGAPDGQGGWTPLEGAPYSDRLPSYTRLDLRLTRLFPMGALRAVAFAEVMNALARHNAARFTYSPDFATRRTEESYFSRRILVAGASLSW